MGPIALALALVAAGAAVFKGRPAAEREAAEQGAALPAGNGAVPVAMFGPPSVDGAAVEAPVRDGRGAARVPLEPDLDWKALRGVFRHGSVEEVDQALASLPEATGLESRDTGRAQDPPRYRGMTPLMHAASSNTPEVVSMLLERGAEVNARDGRGRTPLMHAPDWRRRALRVQRVVALLLEAGAEVNARDVDGNTPLMNAADIEQHEQAMALLLEAGAELESRNSRGDTPLLLAAGNDMPENAFLLLDAGAELDVRDEDLMTPLMKAAERGTVEVLSRLLAAGVELEARDRWGRTALMLASRWQPLYIASTLLEAGAEVNSQCLNGRTALMYAAMESSLPELLDLLREAGADIDVVDSKGRRAIDLARQNEDLFETPAYWDLQ